MAGLLLLLAASLADALPRCDLVEINHYQPDESSGFTQLVAWDWDSQYSRWHAQQWVMVRDWSRAGDVTTFRTESDQIKVRSRLFRETWTRHDPERANNILFEAKHRRRVW